MSRPLQVLFDEHRSIAAVLDALSHLLGEIDRGIAVDLRVFRQIIYYLDVVPERYHHPKEDEYLFAAVKRRTQAADAVIARLESQHQLGAEAIRQLEQLLIRWDAGGTAERASFAKAANDFVARYLEHMRLEESELMPLAEQHLTAEDWAAAESEFARHTDPLKDATRQEDLFRKILYLAPAPIGLGDPAPTEPDAPHR
jgi:hemerythrin-like domain-containing protein